MNPNAKQTITCPHCGKDVSISDALTHEISEKLKGDYEQRLVEERKKASEEAKAEARKDIEDDLKILQEENEHKTKKLEEAREMEITLRKNALKLEEERRSFELEKQRQLDAEREKIRKDAVLEMTEKDKFKFAEYEKKINDMSRALEEARAKADQGSQQLQGEVLELDLEHLLSDSFPDDEISGVAKGVRGGDIVQRVKGKSGRVAGIILWETKRAKWQTPWLSKLREDAHKVSASIAVLVSTSLPDGVEDFKLSEGVVICSYRHALPMAGVLRRSVLQIAVAKQTAENKDENLELLYDYLQSETFRHRFEAFAEGIREMQNDLEYEKRAFERVWKKREIQISKALLNASHMYGELQGVMGQALPEIKTFSLPEKAKE